MQTHRKSFERLTKPSDIPTCVANLRGIKNN